MWDLKTLKTLTYFQVERNEEGGHEREIVNLVSKVNVNVATEAAI